MIYNNGKSEIFQLNLVVTGEPTYYNRTITERTNTPIYYNIETGDKSGVYSMELISGELPPGITMGHSQSVEPYISGECKNAGKIQSYPPCRNGEL